MEKIIEFSPVIFISLLVLHLLIIIILEYYFKIKPNIEIEISIKENKSKVKNRISIAFFTLTFILSIVFDNFNFILIPLTLKNLILAINVLKKFEIGKEKYHYITSVVFHPLQIISLILMAFSPY